MCFSCQYFYRNILGYVNSVHLPFLYGIVWEFTLFVLTLGLACSFNVPFFLCHVVLVRQVGSCPQAYLPGTGDTLITKEVPHDRGPFIALPIGLTSSIASNVGDSSA